ncbi:hypothetical protein KJ359_000493 [Pestalotiopsis sp. 9143b]|nr:hypothetical protein KJ359_000493 [Pestalotiopsis sp. 9143b]
MNRTAAFRAANASGHAPQVAFNRNVSRFEQLSWDARLQIVSLLPAKDALALARVNKATREWVITAIYQKDFAEAEESDQAIPLSLQWVVWENKITLFDMALLCLEEAGLDLKNVFSRGLGIDCELSRFLARKNRGEEWLHAEFPARIFRSRLRQVQLIDLACIRGNDVMVEILATLAGRISFQRLPASGFISHLSFAADRTIADILLRRRAHTGETERDYALTDIVSRIAERSRRYGAGPRLNRASNPASVLDHVFPRLTIYTDFAHLEFHPMVEALHDHSGEALGIMGYHIPLMRQLVHRDTGVVCNMMNIALGLGNLSVIGILLDVGAVVELEFFCAAYMRHAHLRNARALVGRLLDVIPRDARMQGKTLAEWAIRGGDFGLLFLLAQRGFHQPDTGIHMSMESSNRH